MLADDLSFDVAPQNGVVFSTYNTSCVDGVGTRTPSPHVELLSFYVSFPEVARQGGSGLDKPPLWKFNRSITLSLGVLFAERKVSSAGFTD